MTPDRIALVTGANKGLGFGDQLAAGPAGHPGPDGCRNTAKVRLAAKELLTDDLPVEFSQLNITKHEQIRNAAASIKKRFGKLDILVGNAGMSAGS